MAIRSHIGMLLGALTSCWAAILPPLLPHPAGDELSPFVPGEFGGDIRYLAAHYLPPPSGDTTYVFDLCDGGAFGLFLATNDLADRHALIVFSHGEAVCGPYGTEYGFYPGPNVWAGDDPPHFSMRDLCRVVGPAAVGQIHNVILSGCDRERTLSSERVRQSFPQATNIIRAPAGQNGYYNVFLDTLVYRAALLRQLYPRSGAGHDLSIGMTSNRFSLITLYIAESFLPDAKSPFRVVPAGRECIDPPR